MSDVDTAAKADLSKDEVISQKVQALSSLSQDDVASLEFDIIYGICQQMGAWLITKGEISGRIMGNGKEFKAEVSKIFKMDDTVEGHPRSELTGKSLPKYIDLAKLCHPACECLVNKYDSEKQSFHQSNHYQTILTGAWSSIWKVAEAVAKEGGKVNTTKRLEVAREGFWLCMNLLNEGYASPKEAVRERCQDFITAVTNSKYYKGLVICDLPPVLFEFIIFLSRAFGYMRKSFYFWVQMLYILLENHFF